MFATQIFAPWIRTLSLCLLITQVLWLASPEALKTCQPGVARKTSLCVQQLQPDHPLREPAANVPLPAEMDMEKVNSMGFREFVDVFGNVIERCPLIAAAVWSQRPFSDLEDLEKHFSAFIDALPQSGQEGVLRCFPDLAGRELQRGALTAESQREHSAAGLTSLGAEERLRLAELNAQYRARFGFPFVLAARLSDREAVLRELARRLHRPPALELRTALGEVKKIGRLRLADLLGADPSRL